MPVLSRLRRVLVDWALPAWFLTCALLFALTTFCATLNFALRQPTFDQYKEYGNYLSQPFLTSVLMLENGHHPVFPALIANIELSWFGGNQYLQLFMGTLCVFLTCGLIAWTAWREREMPRSARAAGVMLAITGVLWLANARMLIQGVGQLQIYLVALSVVVAISCTWHAARKDSWGWIVAAALACIVAMFTFGAGVAGFPTVIVLGLLLRMRWQKILSALLIFVLCLFLYVFILPGHQGVQDSLALRPLDASIAVAQWLSSPWVNAFLGFADPPLQPWMSVSLIDPLDQLLYRAANGLVAVTNMSWQSISTLLGFAGILVFVIRLARRYLQRVNFSRYETLATGLCLFSLMTAAIIGVGRLDYLQANPNQVYADRYLAWPSLFWMALALLLLSDAYQLRNRAVAALGLLFLVALPVVLYPTHRVWGGWAAAVYQSTQRSAAAVRSDVYDKAVFPEGADAERADVVRTLSLFKQHHVAMFADSRWELMGTRQPSAEQSREIILDAQVVNTFNDVLNGLPAAQIEGFVSHGIASVAHEGQLAILDDDDRVVGLAELSFVANEPHALRLDIPRKRGFDGYIHDYQPSLSYRLVLLQADAKRTLLLKRIDPRH